MSETSGNLTAASPIPWYKRNVTFDPKSLFKAFGEAAMDLADGKRVAAAKKIFTVITAGSLQEDPHGLAWLLVTKSLTCAAARIAKESGNHIKSDPDTINLDHLDQDLAAFFKKLEIEIPPDFLVHPQRMPVIEDMKGLLKKWLLAHEMESSRVETAVQRLNDYFVLELDIEWREGKADYEPVAKRLTSPFSPSADMNRSWVSYHALLKEKLHEPLFGVETFDITQVYVPLRAYFVKEEKRPKVRRDDPVSHKIPRGEQKYQAVELHQYLNEWIDKGLTTRKNSLKVITGGPGSGKSTFVNTFAAEISEKGAVRVLCIPLHEFDMGGDFKKSLGEYVEDQRWFDANPLEGEDVQPMLVILDGLDELPLRHNEAMENARQFVDHINHFLSRYYARQLFVVITGRTLVTDSIQRELPENEQVLHLVPYLIKDEKIIENCTPKELLEIDQRDEWWKKYGAATGQLYSKLPEELTIAGEKVDDLTAQPLLNYLVALTLSDGKVDLNEQPNIAMIYGDLLRQIYEGIHNNKRINPMIKALSNDKFETLLQEIAVAVWHGNSGRSTTLGGITERCVKCNLNKELEAISQDTDTGVLRLLAAFYFRQYGSATQRNRVVEFTHKSFFAYLIARRIIMEIDILNRQFNLMEEYPAIGFTENEALKKWCELCGPSEIDTDIVTFLINIISLMPIDSVGIFQNMLIHLFDYMLLYGLPIERVMDNLSHKDMETQSSNAEEALLAVISAFANISENKVVINWYGEYGFAQWLRKIQGIKKVENSLVNYLSFQDLSGSRVSYSMIENSNLFMTDLHHVNLQGANLRRSNLSKSNLKNAKLDLANLQDANLEKANLSEVDLSAAVLRHANLANANLQGATLLEADFRGANLRNADLRNARFTDADFRFALVKDTKVNNPKALVNIKIDSFSGFIFENDKSIEKEKKQRDNRDRDLESIDREGSLILSANSSIFPTDLAQVFTWVSFFYEGVRLALTSPYEDEYDLLYKCLRPGLYSELNDKYSLRLVSVRMGSVECICNGLKYILKIMKVAGKTVRPFLENITKKERDKNEYLAEMEKIKQEGEKQRELIKIKKNQSIVDQAIQLKNGLLKDPDLSDGFKQEIERIILNSLNSENLNQGNIITKDQSDVIYILADISNQKLLELADSMGLQIIIDSHNILDN